MDSEFKRAMSPSLALLVLASLTPAEHQVDIEDENVQTLRLHDAPDLVGISVNVDTSRRAYEIAARYRRKGVPVILGGIHASANPEEATNYADSVCIGEAEELWEKILLDTTRGQLRRQYYNPVPSALSKVPLPRWEILKRSRYLYTNILFTSRGCPFKCEFCYNSCEYVHQQVRHRPVEDLLKELACLGTKQVLFIDDNFIGEVRWTREFLRAIKPLGLTWHAAVSANVGTFPGLLNEMRDSGCQSLFIGFETINRDSLRSVKKHQNNIESYEDLIGCLHARGIMVNASVVSLTLLYI